MSVHGRSTDVPVTVPSTDTRTWGGGMVCPFMDIPWTSQLLCHPQILGHGVDVPWMSQLLCHPRILGHGVVVYSASVHGRSMDVPVTVPSTDTRTWGGAI